MSFPRFPAVWRALAGLTIGIALAATSVALVELRGFFHPLFIFLAAPSIGFVDVLNMIGIRSDTVDLMVPIFFFPVLWMLVLLCFGERQRTWLVVTEVVFLIAVAAVWGYGVVIIREFV